MITENAFFSFRQTECTVVFQSEVFVDTRYDVIVLRTIKSNIIAS